MIHSLSVELIPTVRAHCVNRTTGSRSFPDIVSAAAGTVRASTSVRIAVHTALRSPRTPEPLLANTAATRPTYAGDGLLVTSRWIICRAKNGPVFAWLNNRSSAMRSASGPGVFAGMVVPRNATARFEWLAGLNHIGLVANRVLGTS